MTTLAPLRQLSETILDAGIQNTNYFNGRVLAAGDLQTDQAANRLQHAQLGQAVGAGVVSGLEVALVSDGSDGLAPVVSVTQGLAFNANGQAAALPVNVQLALARQTTAATVDAGLFADCAPPSTSAVPQQAGLYILTIDPGSGYSGRAPMVGFGDAGIAKGCGSRYAVEGVSFRLVQLDIASLAALSQATRDAIAALMTQTDAASVSRLRNWVAHVCFGTEELAGFVADLQNRVTVPAAGGSVARQSALGGYGAIDALRASGNIGPADVPLAILQWTLQGVQYLDMWSVRRTLAPAASNIGWPVPGSARPRVEAEARFLQFADQLQGLVDSSMTETALLALQASQWFRYLPPAAAIPVATGVLRGFDWRQFLTGVVYDKPWFIEGAKLASLFDRALAYAPIDPLDGTLVRVYQTRENIQAIDNASAGNAPTQYVVLVNGQVPFEGKARFNLNHFSYANFV